QNTKQAKGRRKLLARLPRLGSPVGSEGAMALRLDVADRGGDQVVVANHARIGINDQVLIQDFTTALKRGEILGLLGPNGAGKSTLLRSMLGEHDIMGGELRLGGSIKAAYYRQDMSQVPLDRSIYDVIADLRPLWERRQVQSHLARFGFSGDEVQRSAGTLSGGERARVALAMIVLARANLLMLDEPTNHLDVESIEALEDALEEYDGTVILVSHDRELLRTLVDRVWVLHEKHITDFAGTFGEWEIASKERAHAAAVNAAEEESLRRVHEKQKTKRKEHERGKDRDNTRNARRKAEEAEQRVTALEGRIVTVTTTLADPELYMTVDGKRRALNLGRDLEALKKKLDDAINDWTSATQAAESGSATAR
ncbi:MAG: ATP-binding cassette domain-containing protein, partial [Gemmatimonadaceae bacterium]